MRAFKGLGTALSLLVAAVLILPAAGCTGPQQFKTDTFQRNEFSGEGWGPNAMTWNGRDLLIADGSMIQDINRIRTGRFKEPFSLYNKNGFYMYGRLPEPLPMQLQITGMAFEGECCDKGVLWVADYKRKMLIKFNKDYDVLQKISTPGEDPSGVAFDGQNLWVSDSKFSKIYELSAESGLVLREYDSPIGTPMGLAWDCDGLWITGVDSCKNKSKSCYIARLVRLDPGTAKLTNEYILPKGMQRPGSVTFQDDIIWVGDLVLSRVFKFSKSDMAMKDVVDDRVYASPITAKKRRIIVKKMSDDAHASMASEDLSVAAQRAQESARQAELRTSEAAKQAQEAAQRAETAAEIAKKAFELNLQK